MIEGDLGKHKTVVTSVFYLKEYCLVSILSVVEKQ